MSSEAEPIEHERTLEEQNEEIIDLLKAILMGIEMIADQEQGTLLDDVSGEL